MGESVLTKKFSRSTFVKLAGSLGAAVMGSSLTRCGPSAPKVPTGEHKYIRSVCLQCPSGCGLEVRVINGRAVKVDGNPEHPVNEGGLCPRGANSLQVLYDPDRIKGPMKRTNPKKGIDEDPGFVSISWDEAINEVVNHLKKLKVEEREHTLAIMAGRLRGSTGMLYYAFGKLFGTPNNVGHGTICASGSQQSKLYTQGYKSYSAYDYENARYVISFGAGFLESFRPVSGLIKNWGKMHRGGPNRTKFVQVDVRVSVTANKADEYMLVKPGTDGALALGMVHTILTEGLWNRLFVGDFRNKDQKFETGKSVTAGDFNEVWTHGLVEWWNNVVKDYTPEKAAEDCGVPAATIRRIATEFASVYPGIALMERGVGTHYNGTHSGMVVHSLNALVGSVYAKGGIFGQEGVPFGAVPKFDDYIDAATKYKLETTPKIGKYQDVSYSHAKGSPYKLSTIMYLYTNPYFSVPDLNHVQEAFKDVYQIDFSPFMSESVLYSDIVMPSRTFLEMHQDDPVYPTAGYPVSGIRQPVVEPLFDTRQVDNVLIEIGKRMGGKMGDYFTLIDSIENIIDLKAKGLGITADEWRTRGVWYRKPYAYEYKNGVFYKNGNAMSAGAVKEEILTTPTGKFEFASSELKKKGENPYPGFTPSKFHGDAEHDLYFCTYKVITSPEGRGSNQPFLTEMYGLHVKQANSNWVELHPETAKARKINDGDLVWVESKVGKIKTRAKITLTAQPNVVNMPHGLGRKAYGRWSMNETSKHGVYVNQILFHQSDPLSGLASFNDTKVKVYKA